jgi:hypothetical protein
MTRVQYYPVLHIEWLLKRLNPKLDSTKQFLLLNNLFVVLQIQIVDIY